MSIARVAVPIAADRLFDYWVPAGLQLGRGSVVRVVIGRRSAVGVVVAVSGDSAVDASLLKPVAEVVSSTVPIADDVLRLAEFAARYYRQPAGLMLANALPPLLGPRRRRNAGPAEPRAEAGADAHFRGDLNVAQRRAAEEIVESLRRFRVLLLRGVTGSGKTAVYLAAARDAIAAGGQVLLLVPEISLTPQLAARVAASLAGAELTVLHSALSAGERASGWRAAAEGRARIVLGTRLAVFAPLPSLALIVVDEEHDASYRSDEGARYHARDLAIVRARDRGVPVVLGSATPSLESHRRAKSGRYVDLALTARAHAQASAPVVRFVANRAPRGSGPLVEAACEAIATRLLRGEQSLVFVNRRGYAPSLLCFACGWAASCGRCSARLVYHREAARLRCHHCGHERRVVAACPDCGNQDLTPVGAGTQRLEQQLRERFPGARIARVDRDSTGRREAFDRLVEDVLAGDIDVLVGTQMLAKGHDFPRLTLVAVLGADNALYSADFRATERMFALLMQVSGRAGRASLPGEVIVQTDFADHPVYAALAAQDYESFAATLLEERRQASLPPFAHLARVIAQAHRRSDVDDFLLAAHAAAVGLIAGLALPCDCHPPSAPAIERRAGVERGQLLLQSRRRPALHALLDAWLPQLDALARRRVRWNIDIDPLTVA